MFDETASTSAVGSSTCSTRDCRRTCFLLGEPSSDGDDEPVSCDVDARSMRCRSPLSTADANVIIEALKEAIPTIKSPPDT